ncbi:Protein kinase C-binding protein nell2 [Dissostichus eleginoides]|nr:Protein kinase C-binding protein nell2 [Dissostichus eleginoides]
MPMSQQAWEVVSLPSLPLLSYSTPPSVDAALIHTAEGASVQLVRQRQLAFCIPCNPPVPRKLFLVLGIFCASSVVGFGVDPALRISVFDELTLGEGFDGVTQVQGFHSESRAFHFQGSAREVMAPVEVSKKMIQKLRGKNEFTVLATLKQEHLNSGVILSIHHSEHRFLELESSGQRSEVRLHYRTKGQQPHTEVFPYSLADDQWHKVSVAVSASHVILHIDCNRIYERVVEAPYMDIPEDASFWLGQRNAAHGFFKGVMQDVEILVMPQGYIAQCPDLNRTCPTCNDFHGLVQKIMELQDILAKTSSKLSRAEEKMNGLDGCYCERTCSVKGVVYREDEGWTDGCRNCTCTNGTVQCEAISCPPPQCPAGTAPAYVKGACCKECQPVCLFGGREMVEGDQKAVRDSSGRCLLFECRDRTMHRVVPSEPCPELNCAESEQITLNGRCCKVCRGHDFCLEGHGCVEHSDCVNLEAGDCCVCKDGFRPLRDDNAYCEDIDECAEGKHYCRENTMCVNTPGSFMCICHTGYIRIDDYSCTEHDECLSGLHNCDENALCFNMVGGHSCSCKPGYTGNGTVCKAMCDGLCQNGGTCFSPNNCVCQQGFTGNRCETAERVLRTSSLIQFHRQGPMLQDQSLRQRLETSAVVQCERGSPLEESVRQAEEKRSWLDEHGKAFTKSELPTPRTLRAFRGLPRDATTPAAAAD